MGSLWVCLAFRSSAVRRARSRGIDVAYPQRMEADRLRSLQRRVRDSRALPGPEREVSLCAGAPACSPDRVRLHMLQRARVTHRRSRLSSSALSLGSNLQQVACGHARLQRNLRGSLARPPGDALSTRRPTRAPHAKPNVGAQESSQRALDQIHHVRVFGRFFLLTCPRQVRRFRLGP